MQEMKRFFLYISKKRSIFAQNFVRRNQNFVRRNEKKIIYIACEFLKPMASNIKSWIVSKKFSLGNGPGQRESITVKNIAYLNASLLRCVFYDLSYNVLIKSYDNRIIRAG